MPILQAGAAEIRELDVDAYWAVKPLPSSFGLALRASRGRSVRVVLDIDDDDLGLAREFVAQGPLNRLRLLRRGDSPLRIRRLERRVQGADLITVASRAVEERVLGRVSGEARPPTVRVPHARHVRNSPLPWSVDDGRVRLGFFGTVRRHKGLQVLLDLLRRRDDLVLCLLRGGLQGDAGRLMVDHPRVEIIHGDPTQALARVHAAIIPQGTSPWADVQLPAKLCDAMSVGRPVLATHTTAIAEFAGPGVLLIQDWAADDEVDRAIMRVATEGRALGIRNLRFASQLFDSTAIGERLEATLHRLVGEDRT